MKLAQAEAFSWSTPCCTCAMMLVHQGQRHEAGQAMSQHLPWIWQLLRSSNAWLPQRFSPWRAFEVDGMNTECS
jgi:hypothetical protein